MIDIAMMLSRDPVLTTIVKKKKKKKKKSKLTKQKTFYNKVSTSKNRFIFKDRNPRQKRIQNPVKHLRWSIFQK